MSEEKRTNIRNNTAEFLNRLFKSDFDRHIKRVLDSNKQAIEEEKNALSSNQEFRTLC